MTSLLLLKLILAPSFVAFLSFIQRRWGDGLGGRLIGLPITTGPFIFIIYLQEGSSFASDAAHGVLVGQVALIIFAWSYSTSAVKYQWRRALAQGSAACIISGAILTSFYIPLGLLLLILLITWSAATKFWPEYSNPPREKSAPRWELPARLVVTVLLILSLTGFASLLGPRVAGALSTYPVITSVLGGFNQRRFGPGATVATLQGMVQVLPLTIFIMTFLTISL
ncbi:MAG: hypothetical protein WCK72_04745 [Actinomycetes bacterium]